MQTGLEHVGCRPRRVTPTALISTSRVVFIRQHKSRAQKVVLEHIFGSSVALVWTNSLLVVDPPRPHRIKPPAKGAHSDSAARERIGEAGNDRPSAGPVSERTCEDPEARDCCVRPDRGQCPVFCRQGHRHGWTFSQPWKSWVVVATS